MTAALAIIAAVGSPSLSATPAPSTAFGAYYGTGGSPRNIATGSVTLAVRGGVSPYTYAWSMTGVSAYTWTISAPTLATTNFVAQAVEAGVDTEATFVCTVTDALGASAVSSPVAATARNLSTA